MLVSLFFHFPSVLISQGYNDHLGATLIHFVRSVVTVIVMTRILNSDKDKNIKKQKKDPQCCSLVVSHFYCLLSLSLSANQNFSMSRLLLPHRSSLVMLELLLFAFRLYLVTDADEVVAELLDGVGGHAGLDGLRVVGDEDSLSGLDDHDAFPAL